MGNVVRIYLNIIGGGLIKQTLVMNLIVEGFTVWLAHLTVLMATKIKTPDRSSNDLY